MDFVQVDEEQAVMIDWSIEMYDEDDDEWEEVSCDRASVPACGDIRADHCCRLLRRAKLRAIRKRPT